MKFKNLIYGLFFMIFAIGCNEKIIDSESSTQDQSLNVNLKAGEIGTYYVAKTGNDNNTGTSSAPFLTIQKAANIVNPGDIVIVGDGTYSSTTPNYGSEIAIVKLTRSGNSSNWITFKSEHKGGAILDGLQYKATHGFMIDGASFIKIEGFVIKDVSLWGIPVLTGSNLNITGNHIYNIGRICTTTTNGLSGIILHSANNIVIEHNNIHDVGRLTPEEGCSNSLYYKYNDHGIYVDNVNSLTVTGNVFYKIQSGWAVQFYSSRGLPSSNASITNNTFAYSGKYTVGFIVMYNTLTNVNIQNNIFYHNADADMKITPSTNYGMQINADYAYKSVVINHNIVYGGSGRMVASAVSGVTVSANMESTNPKMTSPSTFDFTLQSTSPAINAGVNIGITTDHINNAIVGLPDIGAYESTVAGTTTPPVVVPPVVVPPVVVPPVVVPPVVVPPVVVPPVVVPPVVVPPVVVPKIYYNTSMAARATKNDCGDDYISSTETYTVSSNKYSSTVSQEDANNKALEDLNSNKQTYANTNGFCTSNRVHQRRH